MATTAACSRASAGSISGSGLASANTIGLVGHRGDVAPSRTPGAETPMNTSAPTTASFSVPVTPSALVCSAIHGSCRSSPSRPRCTTPAMSATTTCRAPGRQQQLDDRRAGRPGPGHHDPDLAHVLATTRSALYSAARTTIAVPCWSSWKTGMSSCSRSRRLHLEAARRRDVLQVDPGEPGRDRPHHRDDLVDVLGVQAQRPGVDAGEPLEQRRLALHHRQRRLRTDVAQPQHGRAVGDHRDAVALDRQAGGRPPGSWRWPGRPGPPPACRSSRGRHGCGSGAWPASRSCRPGASGRSGR